MELLHMHFHLQYLSKGHKCSLLPVTHNILQNFKDVSVGIAVQLFLFMMHVYIILAGSVYTVNTLYIQNLSINLETGKLM